MNIPEQQQIDHWLSVSQDAITRKWELRNSGFYEQEDLPLQGMYGSLASFHASLARAKFLNGDPLEEVRAEFANAARNAMKNFAMAYDENDPDYQGDAAKLSWVSETTGIKGMNWALMSADFNLAAEMAALYRTRPDGKMLAIDTNRYANALALTIRDKREPALELLTAQFEDYKKKPPKSPADRNYYSLILALYGILVGEQEKFVEGLELQLKSYRGYAKGEGKDTDEEFICDDAVALAILGIHHGLEVAEEYEMLPKGLLIQR
jgi:hypothetical protein